METINCPACEKPHKGSAIILTCSACRHSWMPGTSGEELGIYTQHYAGYRYDPIFAENVRAFIRKQLLPLKSGPARILDVGCGAGEFLVAAQDFGYDAEGIDISQGAVTICRERGVKASVANYLTDELNGNLDIITMWDVMEHLPKPGAFLGRTAQLLGNDGLFVAKIPFFSPLSVWLATHIAKFRGVLLGAPDHVQFYSEKSLSTLLNRHGFRIESLEYGAGMRSANDRGSTHQNFKRSVARTLTRLSGNGNLYLVASSASRPSGATG